MSFCLNLIIIMIMQALLIKNFIHEHITLFNAALLSLFQNQRHPGLVHLKCSLYLLSHLKAINFRHIDICENETVDSETLAESLLDYREGFFG